MDKRPLRVTSRIRPLLLLHQHPLEFPTPHRWRRHITSYHPPPQPPVLRCLWRQRGREEVSTTTTIVVHHSMRPRTRARARKCLEWCKTLRERIIMEGNSFGRSQSSHARAQRKTVFCSSMNVWNNNECIKLNYSSVPNQSAAASQPISCHRPLLQNRNTDGGGQIHNQLIHSIQHRNKSLDWYSNKVVLCFCLILFWPHQLCCAPGVS